MEIQDKQIALFGGKTGLLGQALHHSFEAAHANVSSFSSADCDILDPKSVEDLLNKIKPDILINAVGYTNVDLAEDEEEAAFALNSVGPLLLAAEAARRRIPFVHFSTDFVFAGNQTTPYTTDAHPGATSVYGMSKTGGERNILALGYDKTLIIRISWLFGPGKTNFVKKILNLCGTRDHLTVVNDQTGSPSYTTDIAVNTAKLIELDATGIYHLSNSGQSTWYELATEASKIAQTKCTIAPVSSSEYPTKAIRPQYSVLDLSKFEDLVGYKPRHWKEALHDYINRHIIS